MTFRSCVLELLHADKMTDRHDQAHKPFYFLQNSVGRNQKATAKAT
jgi:hypothetical protein